METWSGPPHDHRSSSTFTQPQRKNSYSRGLSGYLPFPPIVCFRFFHGCLSFPTWLAGLLCCQPAKSTLAISMWCLCFLSLVCNKAFFLHLPVIHTFITRNVDVHVQSCVSACCQVLGVIRPGFTYVIFCLWTGGR